MRVLADAESDHQQRHQLGDERGGEDPDSDGLPEMAFVDQHLGRDAQAGQRQNPGQGDGFGEAEAQPEVVDDVGGDRQSGQQGNEDGQRRGEEVPAANGGHEPVDVELVQSDEEEQEKDADAEQDLNLGGGLNDAGDRPQQNPRRRIRNDGIHPEAPQDPLDQLRHHDQQTDRKQRTLNHVRATPFFLVEFPGRPGLPVPCGGRRDGFPFAPLVSRAEASHRQAPGGNPYDAARSVDSSTFSPATLPPAETGGGNGSRQSTRKRTRV